MIGIQPMMLVRVLQAIMCRNSSQKHAVLRSHWKLLIKQQRILIEALETSKSYWTMRVVRSDHHDFRVRLTAPMAKWLGHVRILAIVTTCPTILDASVTQNVGVTQDATALSALFTAHTRRPIPPLQDRSRKNGRPKFALSFLSKPLRYPGMRDWHLFLSREPVTLETVARLVGEDHPPSLLSSALQSIIRFAR